MSVSGLFSNMNCFGDNVRSSVKDALPSVDDGSNESVCDGAFRTGPSPNGMSKCVVNSRNSRRRASRLRGSTASAIVLNAARSLARDCAASHATSSGVSSDIFMPHYVHPTKWREYSPASPDKIVDPNCLVGKSGLRLYLYIDYCISYQLTRISARAMDVEADNNGSVGEYSYCAAARSMTSSSSLCSRPTSTPTGSKRPGNCSWRAGPGPPREFPSRALRR